MEDRSINYIKALSHPTRIAIIREIRAGSATSPRGIQIAWIERSGSGAARTRTRARSTPAAPDPIPALGTISYHVRELTKLGVIEVASTAPRRGALEHFYKLVPNFEKHLAETRKLLETL